jgi:hypothetical protein
VNLVARKRRLGLREDSSVWDGLANALLPRRPTNISLWVQRFRLDLAVWSKDIVDMPAGVLRSYFDVMTVIHPKQLLWEAPEDANQPG